MSLTITRGYLISKQDYADFDSIITFINEHGNKFSCMAKGVRKIKSKNSLSLNTGNFNEFEFFLARDDHKVSKLVRSVCINQITWPLMKPSFFLLNNLANTLTYPNIKNFVFYKNMIEMIIEDKTNDDKLMLIILRKFCELSGISLYTNNCVLCHSPKIKTMSFKARGLLCEDCLKKNKFDKHDINFSKLIFFLFKNQFEELDQYESIYEPAIEKIAKFIHDNIGINVLEIKRS